GGVGVESGVALRARDCSWDAGVDRDMDGAPLDVRQSSSVDLIISGTGTREYERVSAEIDARARRRRESGGAPPGTAPDDDGHDGGDDGGGLALPLGAAGLAAAGVAGLVLWRRRRMAA